MFVLEPKTAPLHAAARSPWLLGVGSFSVSIVVVFCVLLIDDRHPRSPLPTPSLLQPEEALSDDFLFPMTSRLSYASSPESDLELSPEPRSLDNSAVPSAGHLLHQHLLSGSSAAASSSRLVRSTSDPSIATQEELGSIPNYSGPPPYTLVPSYKQVGAFFSWVDVSWALVYDERRVWWWVC